MLKPVLNAAGRILARFLARPRGYAGNVPTSSLALLEQSIRPGDVLLVEGTSRFSEAIKYLTQSTWSHSALCVGHLAPNGTAEPAGNPATMLVEADVLEGVRAVPLAYYADIHTRICRPVGLSAKELQDVLRFVVARLGHQYDLRNVADLARFLLTTPPVPQRWRRDLLTFGSGSPTRAICSSLIAQAFQSVEYPILPIPEPPRSNQPALASAAAERFRRQHYTLFAPRDFDVSPYFEIVKPRLHAGFDPHELRWSDRPVIRGVPGHAVPTEHP